MCPLMQAFRRPQWIHKAQIIFVSGFRNCLFHERRPSCRQISQKHAACGHINGKGTAVRQSYSFFSTSLDSSKSARANAKKRKISEEHREDDEPDSSIPDFLLSSVETDLLSTPYKPPAKASVSDAEAINLPDVIVPYPFKYVVVDGPGNNVENVPTVKHGLDKLLFSPGVHRLQDEKTKAYNFHESLGKLTQPDEFDFDSLTPYVTASKDNILHSLSKEHGTRYASSTSSITSLLCKMYQMLTYDRGLNTNQFSKEFDGESLRFTPAFRYPTSVYLRFVDGIYMIDQEKRLNSDGTPAEDSTILMHQGKSMEKLLTVEPEEYEYFLKSSTLPRVEPPPETYNYAIVDKFLLRSQLDCQDPRLPNRTFDLKTRATLPIRMDPQNYKENIGYHLKEKVGLFNSYEREYYDMARSTMMKYNFQARIGNMDGILVAYHNTRQIFGAEYLPIEVMDNALFGSRELGDAFFSMCVKSLGCILDRVLSDLANDVSACLDWRMTLRFDEHQNNLVLFAEEVVPPNEEPESSSDEGQERSHWLYKYRISTIPYVNNVPQVSKSTIFPTTDVGHKRFVKRWSVEMDVVREAKAFGVPMKPKESHRPGGRLSAKGRGAKRRSSIASESTVGNFSFAGETWMSDTGVPSRGLVSSDIFAGSLPGESRFDSGAFESSSNYIESQEGGVAANGDAIVEYSENSDDDDDDAIVFDKAEDTWNGLEVSDESQPRGLDVGNEPVDDLNMKERSDQDNSFNGKLQFRPSSGFASETDSLPEIDDSESPELGVHNDTSISVDVLDHQYTLGALIEPKKKSNRKMIGDDDDDLSDLSSFINAPTSKSTVVEENDGNLEREAKAEKSLWLAYARTRSKTINIRDMSETDESRREFIQYLRRMADFDGDSQCDIGNGEKDSGGDLFRETELNDGEHEQRR